MLARLIVAAALGTAMWVLPAQAADQIRIATEGAYKPYNFKDASGNLVGFEVDLAQELCKRMAVQCKLVEQAWDGIIPSLVAKKYDAIMAGMSIKAEREKVISFSRHYAATPIRFAVPKDSALASYQSEIEAITLADVDAKEQEALDSMKAVLKGKTVGVQVSTTHEDFMQKHMPDISLKSYDTMDNMILDLQAGRIDAGYTAVTFLLPIIEKSNDIAMIGPDMTGGPLGRGVAVGVRKEDSKLRERFSVAIDTMIADKSLSKLAVKWFGFDASAAE
ncbi:MAG: transporter substrate-binding domain-containing protein [Hyphomicrobiaceae bacterium]